MCKKLALIEQKKIEQGFLLRTQLAILRRLQQGTEQGILLPLIFQAKERHQQKKPFKISITVEEGEGWSNLIGYIYAIKQKTFLLCNIYPLTFQSRVIKVFIYSMCLASVCFYSICPAVSWIFKTFYRFVYLSKTHETPGQIESKKTHRMSPGTLSKLTTLINQD